MSSAVPKSAQKKRSPIVVVVGHVDHGKTTLLDTIRKSKGAKGERIEDVTDKESGGITQHIGAYEVEHSGQKLTFIDTPGHEAFSAMRMRGTNVADIALLIVAADDGVKPQTKEALKFIAASKIPFIVAANKIDKTGADIERVKNDLGVENILVEGRGGKVPIIGVSAKEGTGVDDLLDTILIMAELEEFKYDAVLPAEGYVLESHKDAKRGVTTNIVLTNGTLRTGDFVVCGPTHGKLKIMESFGGERIKGATPSSPLTIVGLDSVSVSGDPCKVVFTEAEARTEVEKHQKLTEERQAHLLMEPEDQEHVIPLIVRADVRGSLEALVDSLRQIKSERVGIKILKCDCGAVTDSDIKLAEASGALIFSFKVKLSKDIKQFAEQKKINIKSHDVIYEFIEDVRKHMGKMLAPELVRTEIGRMEVLAIFRTEPARMIFGGKVVSGKLKKGAKVEIFRDDEKMGTGKIVQLQIGEKKNDEVAKGNETGLLYEGKVKVKEGDEIVAYEEEKVYPTL